MNKVVSAFDCLMRGFADLRAKWTCYFQCSHIVLHTFSGFAPFPGLKQLQLVPPIPKTHSRKCSSNDVFTFSAGKTPFCMQRNSCFQRGQSVIVGMVHWECGESGHNPWHNWFNVLRSYFGKWDFQSLNAPFRSSAVPRWLEPIASLCTQSRFHTFHSLVLHSHLHTSSLLATLYYPPSRCRMVNIRPAHDWGCGANSANPPHTMRSNFCDCMIEVVERSPRD